ncbi:MAG: hypothetical protein ACRC4N_05415, partial [Gammaproteobacteria bacterium]
LQRVANQDFGCRRAPYQKQDHSFFKVQWSNHSEGEATWEREDELKAEFPSLFSS